MSGTLVRPAMLVSYSRYSYVLHSYRLYIYFNKEEQTPQNSQLIQITSLESTI